MAGNLSIEQRNTIYYILYTYFWPTLYIYTAGYDVLSDS